MKRIIAIIICLITIIIFTKDIYVFAEELPDNIVLEGNSDGIIFIPGNEEFLVKKDMLPGNSVKRKMKIQNNYDNSYDLYMRAERLSKKEEYDLLTKINIKIIANNKVIYDGPATGENGLANDIYLGNYNAGDSAELYAEATLDGKETSNEYKNKTAKVKWIFTANCKKTNAVETSNEKYLTKTSDDNNIYIYIALSVICIIGIYLGSKVRKKRGEIK